MPKLIDYPRTSYTGAWELAEIIDDTGGKCTVETAANKLNRKVSGSFKAIIGSAVKFGLTTSKRELLTNTTLFRRIKHAYDKNEELQFHREAFLTPPLFTQVCRKFRNRELPVQMLDVMLIREFGVEEINAQNVAKTFVDGCRMCGLLDEHNIIADIDALNNIRTPRRELTSPNPTLQNLTNLVSNPTVPFNTQPASNSNEMGLFEPHNDSFIQTVTNAARHQHPEHDAITNLFGLIERTDTHHELPTSSTTEKTSETESTANNLELEQAMIPTPEQNVALHRLPTKPSTLTVDNYQMQMNGPGINASLDITDEDDLAIAISLLEKIRRQLRSNK